MVSTKKIVILVGLVGAVLWIQRSSLSKLATELQLTEKRHNLHGEKESVKSMFENAATFAQDIALNVKDPPPDNEFVLSEWNLKTAGGLTDADRVMLADIYADADSVFEFGLGESTYIANHVGVPRYAGIDSDASWVTQAREKVSPHYRFYFADIGPTRQWGYPLSVLPKSVYDYQVAPLIAEPLPFDVYMVDGRWRVGCMLLCFLHASARGADPNDTIVLFHDNVQPTFVPEGYRPPSGATRQYYRVADHLFHIFRHSGNILAAYKRKPSTTDEDIHALWLQYYGRVL
jgi:hypothetical protein